MRITKISKVNILFVGLMMMAGLWCCSNQVQAASVTHEIPKVILDGTTLNLDVPPTIGNGRILVPLRAIFEAMGASVSWNDATQTAIAKKESTTVVVVIGGNTASINGINKSLDVAPTVINGRTFAPLRFVAEAFGNNVKWESINKSAYISTPSFEEEVTFEDYGNSPNNILNMGEVVQYDDWVYYRSYDMFGGVSRMREDGSHSTKICNALFPGSINVTKDGVYFKDKNIFYRIHPDGSDREQLTEDLSPNSSASVYVIGDWIYYPNYSDNERLYRMHKDGSSCEKINDDKTCRFVVVGDWIYYTIMVDGPNWDAYRIKTDGSCREKFIDNVGPVLETDGKWVYYTNTLDSLFRVRKDGSEKSLIMANTMSSDYNISGDWIYYINYSDKATLYRVQVDGKNLQKLNDDYCQSPQITGDWVYYSSGMQFYRIRLDGGERQIVP